METTIQHLRPWAMQGEHCNDSTEEIAARQGRRDLYAIARCTVCGQHFANAFVLWRHRPSDVPPEQRTCLNAAQMRRIGMYQVTRGANGVWFDDRRESPLGVAVDIRGDAPERARGATIRH